LPRPAARRETRPLANRAEREKRTRRRPRAVTGVLHDDLIQRRSPTFIVEGASLARGAASRIRRVIPADAWVRVTSM